jgi:hypothetical protein
MLEQELLTLRVWRGIKGQIKLLRKNYMPGVIPANEIDSMVDYLRTIQRGR